MIIRKIKTLIRVPKKAIAGKFVPAANKRAKMYLEKNGLFDIWDLGTSEEFKVQIYDQYNLHLLVRKRHPMSVLEFGSGFSTLTIAHALKMNYEEDCAKNQKSKIKKGKLWSLESSKKWLNNTQAKISGELKSYINLSYSEMEILAINGELCHVSKDLPNITPELIYLDGPDPFDVEGKINGIGFTQECGENRSVISADILFYESSLQNGALIVVDSRFNNSFFLRRNLKRRYKISFNHGHRIWFFELKDKLPPLSLSKLRQ